MRPEQAWKERRSTRAAVTVAALAVAGLAARLPTPGWDAAAVPDLGALATGIGPVLTGFVLVELVALAVPRWRSLRHGGPRGRSSLAFAAYAVAAVLAVLQAWGIVVYAGAIGALLPGVPRAAALATLAAGPFLLAALAAWIDARGLGNGLVLLIAASLAAELVAALRATAAVASPAVVAMLALVVAGAAWLFVRARGRPATPRDAAGPRIPVPSSGVAPLAVPAALLALPVALVGWLPGIRPVVELFRPGTDAALAAEAMLALALVPVLSVLFNRSGPLLRASGATGGEALALARAARRRATVRSALLVAGVLVLGALARQGLRVPGRGFVSAIVVATVVVDLVREWRARGAGAWAAVWPLHRALEAEPTLARLGAAGIPAFVRGAGFRTLYQFFSPYAPVVVFVSPEHADAAAALLREWHAGDG